MIKKNVILMILWTCTYLNVSSTINGQVKYLGIEQGLSNNYVTDIYQDRMGFMWFGTFDGLNRYDGYQFKTYRNRPGQETSLPDNRITDIMEDTTGRIWVATKIGAAVLDYNDQTFRHLRLHQDKAGTRSIDFAINGLAIDAEGSLFAASEKRGLLAIEAYSGADPIGTSIPLALPGHRTTNYHVRGVETDFRNRLWLVVKDVGICYYDKKNRVVRVKTDVVQSARCIQASASGDIWVGTEQGLFRYNPVSEQLTHYTEQTGLSHNRVTALHKTKENEMWVCTDGGGITIIDLTRQRFRYLLGHDDGGPLSSKAVFAVYEDHQSRQWIGTLRGGVNIIDPQAQKFGIIRHHTPEGKTSSKNFILSFAEGKDHSLWIGTDGSGLSRWDRRTNRFHFFEHQPGVPGTLTSNFVTSVLQDQQGQLWVGTYGGGINRWDAKNRRFIPYPCFHPQKGSEYPNIWQLLEDSKGRIWAATLDGGGLFVLNREHGRFEPVNAGITNALCLIEDADDTFWVGSYAELIHLDLARGRATRYPMGNPVRCIRRNDQQQLWIGTEGGGLLLFNKNTGDFKRYTESEGLPSNVVLQLADDHHGNLWLSTYNGIAKFSPAEGRFQNFYESDGLQSNQFSYNAALELQSGELVFGGIDGFNIFYPDSVVIEPLAPKIVITDIRAGTKPLHDYSVSATPTTAAAVEKLVLPYDDASLSVGFAALEYSFPDKINYAFYLEGWDKDWNHVERQRNAYYSNLREGSYRLRIRSTDANGVWNSEERVLAIEVLPPWWRTYWAYGLYALLGLSAVYAYIVYDRRQTRLTYQVEWSRMEVAKERELSEQKLAFFTHIAHEFRTPLSLIVNPVKDILYGNNKAVDIEGLTLVYRNAKRLLSLVDKLLLFQKAESQSDDLRLVKLDLKHLVHEVFLCFKQHADSRSLDYRFHCAAENVYLFGDREKLEICLFNLISNAIKFTPEQGTVTVKLLERDHYIEITVSDTGCGVPPQIGDALFDRFYRDRLGNKQSVSGFGIGLFLVKKFVKSHHGTVSYVSRENRGSEFTLRLLKGKEHFKGHLLLEDLGEHSMFLEELTEEPPQKMDEADSPATNSPDYAPLPDEQPVMLVADDNLQIRQYIAKIFKKDFSVYTVGNGREALEFIKKHEPDIVISDVVMDGMSGIDLCTCIKQDPALSHIPLILLTASTSKDVKLKGIEGGADDYITKPFDNTLLIARVANLLTSRSQLQAYFYNEITLQSNPHNISKEYSDFLQRCISIVERQLDNTDFTVKSLAEEIGMSHSNLYKRIKSISGKSANEFIRFIRLRTVAKLLVESGCTIREAAFAAGFNDIKYFREQFSKLFGMKPSDYKRKYGKTKKNPLAEPLKTKNSFANT
ncbi:hybrid sensor histidine kinase/response regulator [Parapedobacter defluvii]|uniref:histidine kinase n=2 Tax=Parapedobacter defluvii TaxID=2045106 RepID=A0ABQ1M0U4_9SPHI|nr:hybrid sensor histidine kinase/response regulator [Parapedobacter defluvii]